MTKLLAPDPERVILQHHPGGCLERSLAHHIHPPLGFVRNRLSNVENGEWNESDEKSDPLSEG